MASNVEILAQLERLASAAAAGVKIRFECDDPFGAAFLSALQDSCFPQILAAARRWVKIEEAAEDVASEGSDVTISHLRAALKEPS